jgi:hypothetical protein
MNYAVEFLQQTVKEENRLPFSSDLQYMTEDIVERRPVKCRYEGTKRLLFDRLRELEQDERIEDISKIRDLRNALNIKR